MPFLSIQSLYQLRGLARCQPYQMFPFPYSTYYFDGDADPNNTYYNDPALDAVQLNVNVIGDAAAWGSTAHDVYMNYGLMREYDLTGYMVDGASVYDVAASKDGLDLWRYTGVYAIDQPLANKYVAVEQTGLTPGPQTTGLRVYPGVASTDRWTHSAGSQNDIEVPCYGRPVGFEMYFSQNAARTTSKTFSGYTSFGDQGNWPTPDMMWANDPVTVEGYTRRYIAGILKVGANMATATTDDIQCGVLFEGTPTGGTAYVCIGGIVIAAEEFAFKPRNVSAGFDTIFSDNTYILRGKSQAARTGDISITVRDGPGGGNEIIVSSASSEYYHAFDTYDVKFGWYVDYVVDAGEGTYIGQIYAQSPMMYTHPGWDCSSCALPAEPMFPFPFEEYYFEIDPNWDPNYYDPVSGYYYPLSYYNDASLDAVQYNVEIGGHAPSWESTLYDVYYGPGLLGESKELDGGAPFFAPWLDIVGQGFDTFSSPWVWIDWPLSDRYVAPGCKTPQPWTPGRRIYPGTTTTDTLYQGNAWTEVPCFGEPVWFSAWYSDNPNKTNTATQFSGYTLYGDCTNTNSIGPRLGDGAVDGHVEKSVVGILRAGAEMANLQITDVMWGFYFEGTLTGGTAYACVNGNSVASLTVTFKPNTTWPDMSTIWYYTNPYPPTSPAWGPYSQGYDYTTFLIGEWDPPYQQELLVMPFGIPVDTFNTKWGWYHHFIPATGVGTYGGQIEAGMPAICTHPGWPCTGAPPCAGPPPSVAIFPYESYFLPTQIGGPFPPGYYNDPQLDGVQLNISLIGDEWADSINDVHYGTGLPPTANPLGTDIQLTPTYNSTTKVLTLGGGGGDVHIDPPVSDRYVDPNSLFGPQPTVANIAPGGVYSFPGVAVTTGWNEPATPCYLQVPLYGNGAVGFEAWFSNNRAKTNSAVRFSGYTSYAYSQGAMPIVDPTEEGYVERYVYGIIKCDAELQTCTTDDIMLGALFVGTSTGGTGEIVINGKVVETLTYLFKPARVGGFVNFTNQVNINELAGEAQPYESIELTVSDFLYGNSATIGTYWGTPPYEAINTYNTKWGWYVNYVPDAGPGTYSGNVYANMVEMSTHPGWPCSGPPAQAAAGDLYVLPKEGGVVVDPQDWGLAEGWAGAPNPNPNIFPDGIIKIASSIVDMHTNIFSNSMMAVTADKGLFLTGGNYMELLSPFVWDPQPSLAPTGDFYAVYDYPLLGTEWIGFPDTNLQINDGWYHDTPPMVLKEDGYFYSWGGHRDFYGGLPEPAWASSPGVLPDRTPFDSTYSFAHGGQGITAYNGVETWFRGNANFMADIGMKNDTNYVTTEWEKIVGLPFEPTQVGHLWGYYSFLVDHSNQLWVREQGNPTFTKIANNVSKLLCTQGAVAGSGFSFISTTGQFWVANYIPSGDFTTIDPDAPLVNHFHELTGGPFRDGGFSDWSIGYYAIDTQDRLWLWDWSVDPWDVGGPPTRQVDPGKPVRKAALGTQCLFILTYP